MAHDSKLQFSELESRSSRRPQPQKVISGITRTPDLSWKALQTRRLIQTGSYLNLPPAVIIDLDETAIDNSAHEAGLVVNDAPSIPKPGTTGPRPNRRRRSPALSSSPTTPTKSVKVFLRQQPQRGSEGGHQAHLEALGFPMGGNVVILLAKGQGRMVHGSQGFTFRLNCERLPRVADVR
jgi:hypothetical protein